MAVDLILHAVDPFPGAERVIPVLAHTEHLVPTEERYAPAPDKDDTVQWIRDHWEPDWDFRVEETDDGPVIVEQCEGHDEGRYELFDWMIERRTYDRIAIGPFSTVKAGLDNDSRWLPGPVVSLSRYLHIGAPVRLTPAVAAEIMVRLNVADRSYYRSWRKRSHGFKVGRSRYRRVFGHDRLAKRQNVKKWLAEHTGSLIWLSTE